MTKTPLDLAHAEMQSSGEDEPSQMAFYSRLAASELFVMLAREPSGEAIEPELFDLGDARFVIAFDTEARLSEFAGRTVPYAALPGRSLAEALAGQNIGVALNPDVSASSALLPPEAMEWLHSRLSDAPERLEDRPEEIFAPHGLPEQFLAELDARLAAAQGLARLAYLVGVRYPSGTRSHLLGIVDAIPSSEDALARSVQDALALSGVEAAALDVAFFRSNDSMAALLARHGLRFDLPQSEAPPGPQTPGMDPEKPPRLI